MTIENPGRENPPRTGGGAPEHPPVTDPVSIETSSEDRAAAGERLENLRNNAGRTGQSASTAGAAAGGHGPKASFTDVLKAARPTTTGGKIAVYGGGGLVGGVVGAGAVGLFGFSGGWAVAGGFGTGLGLVEVGLFSFPMFASVARFVETAVNGGKIDLGLGKGGGGPAKH